MLVGILGAGQLGRMLALAGLPLGLRFRFLDPTPDSPAGQVAHQVVGSYSDPAALEEFAKGLDVATFEFENVPVAAAAWVAKRVPIFPAPRALEVGQDALALNGTHLVVTEPEFVTNQTPGLPEGGISLVDI